MNKSRLQYIKFPIQHLGNALIDPQKTFLDIISVGLFATYDQDYNKAFEALSQYNLNVSNEAFSRIVSELFPAFQIDGEVFANIMISLAQEFATSTKSEKEVSTLLMYIAIKSILGKSAVKKVHREHILARMFGYKSAKSMPEPLKEPQSTYFSKYSKEYQFNKVFKELEDHWRLVKLNCKDIRARGIWIADLSKISLYNAMVHVISLSDKSKESNLKSQKQEAFRKAANELKQLPQLKENQILKYCSN
jgi:hypothetical protein